MDFPRIAFTIGDVNGIGPEVLLKALGDADLHTRCRPVVVGNGRLLAEYAGALGMPGVHVGEGWVTVQGQAAELVEIPSAAPLQLGRHSDAAGALAGHAIEYAATAAVQETVDAVVTLPISKAGLNAGGFPFPGHTEMLAAIAGGTPLMILMTRGMRVALVTIHTPLADVPGALSRTRIEERITQFHDSLRGDFGIAAPRIAVLGLNPHAGEGGLIGTEERDTIAPALAAAHAGGINAEGPYPADGFFARYDPGIYDGVLAMYHDQGLIPLKMFARGHGVNVTAGLPIVRTSPDHGTAYDIAGRGIADPASTMEAVQIAVDIVKSRNILKSE